MGTTMKRALEAYLVALLLIVRVFPGIFVFAVWALLALILGFIMDSLELSRTLIVYALVGLFVVGFGVALFFSVYAWPRLSEVIGKIMDQLGEASKS